ncbi:MAG: hypothetical protein WDM78_02650 [Puia sp.]
MPGNLLQLKIQPLDVVDFFPGVVKSLYSLDTPLNFIITIPSLYRMGPFELKFGINDPFITDSSLIG